MHAPIITSCMLFALSARSSKLKDQGRQLTLIDLIWECETEKRRARESGTLDAFAFAFAFGGPNIWVWFSLAVVALAARDPMFPPPQTFSSLFLFYKCTRWCKPGLIFLVIIRVYTLCVVFSGGMQCMCASSSFCVSYLVDGKSMHAMAM